MTHTRIWRELGLETDTDADHDLAEDPGGAAAESIRRRAASRPTARGVHFVPGPYRPGPTAGDFLPKR